jgi:hydroxymethyl cephem carbamoyltransferase
VRILGLNPGHDGAAALLDDGRLAWSLEAEKDSFPRNHPTSILTVMQSLQGLDLAPDAIAIGGWYRSASPGEFDFDAGYYGLQAPVIENSRILGIQCKFVSSSHERSHIFMCLGMSPDSHDECAILVWEGAIGAFYHTTDGGSSFERINVMHGPGHRYGFLYCLADPRFGDDPVPLDVAGKLMALAAFGDPQRASPDVKRVIDRLLCADSAYSLEKADFEDSPLFNCGLESEALHDAARLLTDRLFDCFRDAAQAALPTGIPLLIGGGCGLNCEWNSRWHDLEHFASVFVPPCPNDSGSAIGSAVDAQHALGGGTPIQWSVAAGAAFSEDVVPVGWSCRRLSHDRLARLLASGQVVPFVQSRCEIGPRALGHRSVLASPLNPSMTRTLNKLKHREAYRPIAPCCRAEDFGLYFEGRPDPFMLYFSRVIDPRIPAVTHVDGSARVQVVDDEAPANLYALLKSFGDLTGVAVLCNTSLNYPGRGFINRMSDLVSFCESRSLKTFVVDDAIWHRL